MFQIGQFLSSYWICGLKTLYLVSSTRHQKENFLEEEIFASWCLITKLTKISASRNFPATRYVLITNLAKLAHILEINKPYVYH